MRTTLDLPDKLLCEAKASAARRGVTLKTLVAEALEKELWAPAKGKAQKRRMEFPLIRSKRPGHLKISNAQIEAFLD